MRFISGFLTGVLAGMFCILGPIVAFFGGVFVGYKAFNDDSEEIAIPEDLMAEMIKKGERMKDTKSEAPSIAEEPAS